MNELAKLDRLRTELALAETFEELKLLDIQATALAQIAHRTNQAKDQQDAFGEYRIELEEAKGQWLNDNFPSENSGKSGRSLVPKENQAKMPATKKESAAARLILNEDKELKKKLKKQIKESKDVLSPKTLLKEIRKEKRKKKIETQIEEIEKGVDRPKGLYSVIAADPPWNYGRGYDPEGSRVSNPYPEMSQQQLIDFEIPAAKDCIIWLWTTQKFIWDAKDLLDNWGFEYKAILTWDKEKMGMGSWLRMQTEFCLMGIKGSPILKNMATRDIIREARTSHSTKPEAFYKLVEDLCPGNKIEIFSRSKRNNWETYGDES